MSFIKREFNLDKFRLQHDQVTDFITFENGSERGYRIWRGFWVIYHVIWIILTGVISHFTEGEDSSQQIKWFIYLTNWSYLVLTVSTMLDLWSVCTLRNARRKSDISTIPLCTRLAWISFNISNAAALMVSLMYWIFEYKSDIPITVVSIATHALNSVYVIMNVTVSAMPVRLLHVLHPVLYALVYVIFSVIYQTSGGTNNIGQSYIYKQLDWDNLTNTLLMASLFVFIGIPFCHIIIYILFHFKRFVIRTYCVKPSLSVKQEYEIVTVQTSNHSICEYTSKKEEIIS